MVNASGAQAALRDLKAPAFAQQDIRDWHSYIRISNFTVAVRSMIVAEDGQQSLDLNAGCIERDQNHRLLLVLGRCRIGLAHEDGNLAAWITCSGRPPLASVDYVFVA